MTGCFQGYPNILNLAFNIGTETDGSDSYGFNNPAVAANYLVWIKMPFQLTVNVTTH